jgi:16S rRNA (adenine1518-N6/adenine1519-N6)-dimethyltransferase
MSERKNPFAKKSLGQNFLVDKAAIAKIVESIPEKTPLLLEIGPGRGAISSDLWKRAEVFCVLEKDDVFAEQIAETLFVHGSRNHHVFHADALEFDWEKLWSEPKLDPKTQLSVAANLPYNVATEILFRLLDRCERIPRMTLMFQKEVALRIAAKPSTKAYGGITVLAQNLYEIQVQQILKPGAFRPSPKIDSAVLEFVRRAKPQVELKDEKARRAFSLLVKAAFGHRRKTLENSLTLEWGKLPWKQFQGKAALQSLLSQANIDGMRRAETLTVAEFGALFRACGEP